MKVNLQATFVGIRRGPPGHDGRFTGSIVTLQAVAFDTNPGRQIEMMVDDKQAEKIAPRYQTPVSIAVDFGPEDAGGLRQLMSFLRGTLLDAAWEGPAGEELRRTLRIRLDVCAARGEA